MSGSLPYLNYALQDLSYVFFLGQNDAQGSDPGGEGLSRRQICRKHVEVDLVRGGLGGHEGGQRLDPSCALPHPISLGASHHNGHLHLH